MYNQTIALSNAIQRSHDLWSIQIESRMTNQVAKYINNNYRNLMDWKDIDIICGTDIYKPIYSKIGNIISTLLKTRHCEPIYIVDAILGEMIILNTKIYPYTFANFRSDVNYVNNEDFKSSHLLIIHLLFNTPFKDRFANFACQNNLMLDKHNQLVRAQRHIKLKAKEIKQIAGLCRDVHNEIILTLVYLWYQEYYMKVKGICIGNFTI